ncbi:MAG: hypothetical protein Q9168_003487 [Polycauliona sp. 1 TL-2023]
MAESRKRQREGHDLAGNDHEDGRQAHGDTSDHTPLFVSRAGSEEPDHDRSGPANESRSGPTAGSSEHSLMMDLEPKLPSFLDDDDAEAFNQMGFRLVTPLTNAPSIPTTAESASDHRQGLILPDHESDTESAISEPAIPAQSAPKARKKTKGSPRIIGKPKPPKESWKKFDTAHYTKFNGSNNAKTRAGPFKNDFGIYDAYALVMDPAMKIDEVPDLGVRVDDNISGKLLMANLGRKRLHRAWPAELDNKGMARAMRIPLGHASKTWRNVGDKGFDRDDNLVALKQGEEGWYYDWWHGLQCLMGKEGYDKLIHDKEKYLYRPAYEKFKCEGMGFKIGCKAVVQLPPGDPNDPTRGL